MAAVIVRVIINAVALWAAAILLTDIHFPAAEHFPANDWWKLVLVALIFGLLNAFLRPILRRLSVPITILTLGLFSLVINAVVLLVLAAISDALDLGLRIADFPPTLDGRAIVAAILGALIISIVSVLVAMVLPDKTSWRSRMAL
jgi:putative membrane protein